MIVFFALGSPSTLTFPIDKKVFPLLDETTRLPLLKCLTGPLTSPDMYIASELPVIVELRLPIVLKSRKLCRKFAPRITESVKYLNVFALV